MNIWELEQRMFHVPTSPSGIRPAGKIRPLHEETRFQSGSQSRVTDKKPGKSFAAFLEEAKKKA